MRSLRADGVDDVLALAGEGAGGSEGRCVAGAGGTMGGSGAGGAPGRRGGTAPRVTGGSVTRGDGAVMRPPLPRGVGPGPPVAWWPPRKEPPVGIGTGTGTGRDAARSSNGGGGRAAAGASALVSGSGSRTS